MQAKCGNLFRSLTSAPLGNRVQVSRLSLAVENPEVRRASQGSRYFARALGGPQQVKLAMTPRSNNPAKGR